MIQKPTPHFVVALGVIGLVSYATFVIISTVAADARVMETPIEPTPLPERCAEFYNNGTDEWKDCMGVGLK